MRYSQERRLAARGAVKAVPENCSAYKPKGQRCGEFCPWGSAPASASVANSLPKPLMYPLDSGWFALTPSFYDTARRRWVRTTLTDGNGQGDIRLRDCLPA